MLLMFCGFLVKTESISNENFVETRFPETSTSRPSVDFLAVNYFMISRKITFATSFISFCDISSRISFKQTEHHESTSWRSRKIKELQKMKDLSFFLFVNLILFLQLIINVMFLKDFRMFSDKLLQYFCQ